MTAPRPLPIPDELVMIREGVRAACTPFDDDYWLQREADGSAVALRRVLPGQAGR